MKPRPIGSNSQKDFAPFLKDLCRFTLQKGAEEAGVLSVAGLSFQEQAPEPDPDSLSSYWPRVAYPRDSLPDTLKTYAKAVAFRVTGEAASAEDRRAILIKLYTIAGAAEAHCFYHGYHLAVSLGAENCRTVFCHGETDCQSLTRGKGCRHSLAARPSVEACGLGKAQIMRALGWEPGDGGQDFIGIIFVE